MRWGVVRRLLGIGILCLLASEALLRVILASPPGYIPPSYDGQQGQHQPDSALGYRGVPSFSGRFVREDFDVAVVTDANGDRIDPDHQHEAAAVRVLAAGNSLTFGWGVEASESWPTILVDRNS